jgi:hypothetical protein
LIEDNREIVNWGKTARGRDFEILCLDHLEMFIPTNASSCPRDLIPVFSGQSLS